MAVDTHIFRVSNRTGIAPGRDVVAVERALEDQVPAPYQLHAHHWLILHGRYVCVARKPHCRDLPDPRPLRLRGEEPVTKAYQVVGIGNALVDVISHIEDGFLAENGVERGIMQLIDRDRAVELYGRMGPAREVSGGSAANTIAGLAALGRAHRLRRQGQGRPARRHLRPRPPGAGRGLRHAAGAARRTATRPAAAWCWSARTASAR